MRAFNIQFRHLAYAGEADIQYTANIFKHHDLPFWEHLMLEYKKITRMTDMNGNTDATRKKRFEDSGGKWMNTRVVGSHYIPKLTERIRKAEKN